MRNSTLTNTKVLLIWVFKCTQPFLILRSGRDAEQQDGAHDRGHPAGPGAPGRHPRVASRRVRPGRARGRKKSRRRERTWGAGRGGVGGARAPITKQFARTNGSCGTAAAELACLARPAAQVHGSRRLGGRGCPGAPGCGHVMSEGRSRRSRDGRRRRSRSRSRRSPSGP